MSLSTGEVIDATATRVPPVSAWPQTEEVVGIIAKPRPESIRQSRARLSRTAGARFSEGLQEGAEPTSGTSFTGVPAEPATRGIDRVGPRQLRQSATDRWVDRRWALKQFNPSLRAMIAQQLGRDQ